MRWDAMLDYGFVGIGRDGVIVMLIGWNGRNRGASAMSLSGIGGLAYLL